MALSPLQREWRRALRPTAWVVLEALTEQATPRPGDRAPVAYVSVRALAAELGLSKDTVADALQALRTAGLVSRVDQSKDGTGRFVRGAYRLHLHRPVRTARRNEPSLLTPPSTPPIELASLDTPVISPAAPMPVTSPAAQLSFLDLS